MKVVALLTAKGTNTLSRKNLLPVLGKPLLWYPATAAKSCELITDFYVSSDDQEILNTAVEIGYKEIKRPSALAESNSLHIDAILHALKVMQETDNLIPDILLVLLGNTVYVKKSWVDSCINMIMEDPDITAVTPVFKEQDHHPYRARQLDHNGNLVPYFDFSEKSVSSNRQELPKNYFFCHNFWVLNVKNKQFPHKGFPPWNFMGDKVKPFVVSEGFDVHCAEDIALCETWLKFNDINS